MSYLNKLAYAVFLIFRIYSRDDSFATFYYPRSGFLPVPFQSLGEIQVALPFARDYNAFGQHTNGHFRTYWDKTVTPQLISDFKTYYHAQFGITVKVYASIGGRSSKYPFKITKVSNSTDTWVSNAVESLTNIVKSYNLDGIDVYYEHIHANQHDFVDAIGRLITQLKKNKAITVASIAPSPPLSQHFYAPLFKKYSKSIDTVVYQCHNEAEPVPDAETLVKRFETEATDIYGRTKVLAGYSAIYKDWGTVSPIVYILGSGNILGVVPPAIPFVYDAKGVSLWFVPPELPELMTISNNSSTPWPKWMPEATPTARQNLATA